MNRTDGKFLEELVQLIEQSISPDSKVERDVQMPVLNSKSGETTQCDIVITAGEIPRQTVTIIEVQDRNRAVEINDFRGWLLKREMVGAQHLYCVSRKEFPASIKEQAAQTGGHTVKLITIREIEEAAIPINLFKYTSLFHAIDVPSIKKMEVIIDSDLVKKLGMTLEEVRADLNNVKSNDKKFSWNKITLQALSTYCIDKAPASENNTEGTSQISLGYSDSMPFYFYTHGVFVSLKLKLEYTWTFKQINIPPTVLSYDQDGHGALAWIFETFYQSPLGPIWLKMPVINNSENSYTINGVFVTMPVDTQLSFKLVKFSPPQNNNNNRI